MVLSGVRSALSSLANWLQPPNNEPRILDYNDVLAARALLKQLGLPMELALHILEHAQYWPKRTFAQDEGKTVKVATTMSVNRAAGLCLEAAVFNNPTVDSLHACGENVKIKALEFHIRSRDQGWTSERTSGTFNTWSWLEVSLLRGVDGHISYDGSNALPPSCWNDSVFESPNSFQEKVTPHGWQLMKRPAHAQQGPQAGEDDLAWYLQGNRVATQGRSEDYHVLWTHDGYEGNEGAGRGEGFLDELKDRDRLIVWARARVCEPVRTYHVVADIFVVAWLAMHRRRHQHHRILRLFVNLICFEQHYGGFSKGTSARLIHQDLVGSYQSWPLPTRLSTQLVACLTWHMNFSLSCSHHGLKVSSKSEQVYESSAQVDTVPEQSLKATHCLE